MTPNIQFQADRIFVRNDLFEKIIKSSKATNVEFLMLKEKLGFSPYEVICDEQDFILMSKIQDTDKELIEESDEELFEESDEESDEELIEELDKELIEKSDEELIEESDEELVEIKCPKKMIIQQIGMININLKSTSCC